MSIKNMTRSLMSAALLLMAVPVHAGIFAPAAGESGSTAIDDNDAGIESWATSVKSYSPGDEVDVEFQTPEKALGVAGDSTGTNQGFTFDIV